MTYETDPLVRHEHKKTVAKAIASELFEGALIQLSWEDYPEIGEHDWEDICEMVDGDGPARPSENEYTRAYNALKVRV